MNNNNILVILLSLGSDDTKKASTISISTLPSVYKNTAFEKVFVVGTKASSIKEIKGLSSLTLTPINVQPTKLFSQTPKIDPALVGDDYQASYENTIYTTVENFFKNSKIPFTLYVACEEKSYFDTIPYSYQLASIVKPRSFPFFIKNKKISSFKDFEQPFFDEGLDLYKVYYKAGFHLLKNEVCVPGWAISPNLPWISLIMSLYGVVKSTSDMMLYQELLSIARMRACIFYLSFDVLRIKGVKKDESSFLTEEEEHFFSNYLDKRIRREIFDDDMERFRDIKKIF